MKTIMLATIALLTILGPSSRAEEKIPPAVLKAAAPRIQDCLQVSWNTADGPYLAICYRKSSKSTGPRLIGAGSGPKKESRRPGTARPGFSIRDELVFASDGRWLSTVTVISERDCKILGPSVCRALANIDAWYQSKTGQKAKGPIRIRRTPAEARIHVPGGYGRNLFDQQGKFIEFQSYQD